MKNLFKNYSILQGAVGFTLAEVLITFGIIGIVAAITIVPLVQKYQHKVLETQFKKSVALINQIVLRTKYDLGTDYLAKFCTEHPDGVHYINWQTCTDTISKNLMLFSTINKTYNNTMKYSVDRRKDTIKTYNGKNELTNFDSAFYSIFLTNLMQDGSYLGFYSVGNQLQFSVDINGSRKPNKFGHDIFRFNIDKTKDAVVTGYTPQTNITDEMAEQKYGDDYTGSYKRYYYATYGGPCNLESTREGNGISCAYYALKNKCPYDDTKTYWECLP